MAFNYLSDEEFESDAEEHSHSATQQSKKRHVIHNYFVYSTTTKKSQCKKENCKTFINGKNTTNLKNHLKKPCHKTQYANYVKEVSDQRDVSSAKKSKVRESDQSTSTNQPTLLEINSKKALYAVNSKKQLRLRRRFSFFAGSTSFSSVLAENLDFKQYIRELDPRHVIPNRKCLRKDILAMAQKGKALIRNRIINALSKPLSTADIWTKKGLEIEACAEIVGLNLVSNAMLVDLKRRFDFITIPSSSHFDPTYLLSTILDPNYNLFVINDSVMRNTAIKNVLKIAKQMGVPFSSKPVSENEETDLAMAEERRTQEDGLPKNLFQTSFRRLYQKTVNANAGNNSRSSSSLSNFSDMEGFNHDHAQERCTIQMELLDFINFSSNSDIASTSGSDHIHIDSILFWTKAEQKLRFPFLQRLALSLLAIPASSGASEREFSVAGWQTVGRKNRTTGEHLAAKVFLSCNKDLLRPLLF